MTLDETNKVLTLILHQLMLITTLFSATKSFEHNLTSKEVYEEILEEVSNTNLICFKNSTGIFIKKEETTNEN